MSDPQVDMYPDGLLQRLAEVGVDGVWLYGVLRELAPGGPRFPEFGAGHENRLANLRTLVQRAKKYGIGIYLYINEPRAMAVDNATADQRPAAEAELRYARAARLYFQSAANQTRFVLARDRSTGTSGSPADRPQRLDQLRRILEQEIAIARQMFALAHEDSCIGFEAASQYFYLPLDLVEKAVSCRLIADGLH